MTTGNGRAPPADFVGLLGLDRIHTEVACRILRGRTARLIARELGLTERQVYAHRERIKDRCGVAGVAGLAQAVFTAVLRRIRGAAGATLLARLDALRADGRRHDSVEEARLEHFVHLIGLPPGRLRQMARRCLRDMPYPTSAWDLGIRPSTLKTYARRAAERLDRAPGRTTMALDLAEAVFIAVLSALDATASRSGPDEARQARAGAR